MDKKRAGLRVFGCLLILWGAWLAGAGGWLATLGGSLYYVLAGVATLLCGFLLWRQRRLGLWIYLLLFAFTVVWAITEVGLEFWQLLPRVGLPLAVVLYLSMPWVHGALPARDPSDMRPSGETGAHVVSLSLAGLVVAALCALWIADGEEVDGSAGAVPAVTAGGDRDAAWPAYGASESGTRYSPATQITPDNVEQLQVAWQYQTGDLPEHFPQSTSGWLFEATPILADDTLYLCTPRNIVIALDADTGEEQWRYDPEIDDTGVVTLVCRGVALHETSEPVAECPRRILLGTIDGRLIALDAATGKPCQGFGQGGEVSLRYGLGEVPSGFQSVTSPPSIVGNAAILGGLVADNMTTDAPSGVVRAYDVISGRQLWAWDAARPAETGPLRPDEVFPRGSPNAWTIFSADPELGLVYVPTGNAAGDYYGGGRIEAFDRYASSVVALDAATGRLRWSFQTVHHDLWDYDVGSQPLLVDLPIDGEDVPALIQPTKQGEIFLLDRRNGQPLAAVEERAVPEGDVPGERYSPTQPVSVGMPSFDPPRLTEADMWGVTQVDQLLCRIEFRSRRYEGRFTPPSVTPTIQHPGNFGVMDWGNAAVDEARRILVVNASFMPFLARLVPREEVEADGGGARGFLALLPQSGTPYGVEYGPFLSPLGIPCNAPPWGKLAAIDLDTREILWERRFGTSADQAPLGISVPGVFSLGAAAVTRSGLIFIGGAVDDYLRAFDIASGRELWKGRLPAGGQASAMTYVSEKTGRQYVVISAGGHPYMRTTPGDYVVAYALPD